MTDSIRDPYISSKVIRYPDLCFLKSQSDVFHYTSIYQLQLLLIIRLPLRVQTEHDYQHHSFPQFSFLTISSIQLGNPEHY